MSPSAIIPAAAIALNIENSFGTCIAWENPWATTKRAPGPILTQRAHVGDAKV